MRPFGADLKWHLRCSLFSQARLPLGLVLISAAFASAQEPIRIDTAKSLKHAFDCTVAIRARAGNTVSDGSGVVMTESGRILTAKHVVHGMNSIAVYFSDGRSLPARILYEDESWDLVMLKCNANLPLESACMEGYRESMFEDEYFVCGNPGGHGKTIQKARLSRVNRKSVTWGKARQNVPTIEGPIEPGYSGGGFFNVETGNLHGIIVAKSNTPGLGFVVPTSDYLRFAIQHADDLKSDPRFIAQLRTSFAIGIWAVPIPLVDKRYPVGMVLTAVQKAGPAHNAGWKHGDILVGLGGFKTQTQDDIVYVLDQLKGKGVELPALRVRDGKLEKLTLKVDALEDSAFREHLSVVRKIVESRDEFDASSLGRQF